MLVEPGDAARLARLRASLSASTPDHVTDWVVGARTVLLTFDDPPDLPALERELASRMADAGTAPDATASEVLTIPVRYGGPDLGDVARLLSLTPDEVVAAHTGTEWVCRFIGFAPGFGYLSADGPAPFRLPRRAESRPAVPAGSVALADEYTGVYPRSSPGGWRLLGRTEATLWDLDRVPPALLVPGVRVRFRPL